MLKKILSNTAYVLISLSLGFAIYYFLLSPQSLSPKTPENLDAIASTTPFFAAVLPNEHGVNQPLKQYQGKILVVNFWATWCPPCREEMPELSSLYLAFKDKNVAVLGVAIDEQSLVNTFSKNTPVSYPLLVSEDNGAALSNALGNDKGVLPYTVIIDTHGKITSHYFGRINHAMLATALDKLIAIH